MSSLFKAVINLAANSALLAAFAIGTAIASPAEASSDSSTPSPLKRLAVLDFELMGVGSRGLRLYRLH